MSVEELLAMLQEKGMDDDTIKGLLKDCLDALDKGFEEHDEKAEAEAAGDLLGVDF